MINSADRKVITKTIVAYALIIFVVITGFNMFHKITLINENPEISAIIALLLVVVVSLAGIPTEVCFLICGILSCFILGIPLYGYAEYLWKNASSKSIFMIALSGAVVAILSRGDLLDRVNSIDKNKDPDEFVDIKHQVSVFCLFDKLQAFTKRVKEKSKILAALVLLFQSLLLFVSSIVAASTFSAMMNTQKSKSAANENKLYTNAGILCMCISGCLLLFFVMKSPWWLFFLEFAKNLNVQVQFPLAALLYALFSFIHGYILLSKAESPVQTKTSKSDYLHSLSKRHFIIYFGLIVVFLMFMLPTPISIIGSANGNSDKINLGIITILVLILTAVLAATVITRKIMQKNLAAPRKSNTINDLRRLILGDLKSDAGIKSVIGTLILIITILSFRDMIFSGINMNSSNLASINPTGSIDYFSTDGLLGLLGSLVVLSVVLIIGYILGSNFGAFSIGLIIFNIIAGKIGILNDDFWKRWMIESIIIVSTFCNQVSPVSTNAAAVASKDEDPRAIQKQAWGVKSFLGISALKIQVIAMILCVVLSGVLVTLGVK